MPRISIHVSVAKFVPQNALQTNFSTAEESDLEDNSHAFHPYATVRNPTENNPSHVPLDGNRTIAHICLFLSGQGHTESPTFAPTALSANPESAALPFDIPDRATLNGRKVFGHYFPPYPVSIDNATPNSDFYTTQYMTVHGENNAHVNSAGFIRDRPAPRPPIADPQWRQRDLETEVRQAVAAGLDGFSVDIMAKATDTSWWGSTVPTALMQSGRQQSIRISKIMLMPDMNGFVQKHDRSCKVRSRDETVFDHGIIVFKLERTDGS